MTNRDRQNALDKVRYVASYDAGIDLSGQMPECKRCVYSNNTKCTLSYEIRLRNNTCAKAYNKKGVTK